MALLGILAASAAERGRLEVTSPQPGAVVAGGGAVVISWSARPSEGTVLILASQDGGATWKEVATRPGDADIFLWETGALPEDLPVRLRLKLRDAAGAVLAEADAPGTFSVDRKAPTARVLGPDRSEQARVEVSVEASDAKGSGLASVLLWAAEPGKPWTTVAEAKDASKPIAWTAPHRGRWSLFATAMDRAGNAGTPPGPGDAPHRELFVHTPEPWISSFSVETGDYVVPPGHPLPLSWTVEGDELPAAPVTIEMRGEKGAWVPVGLNLPAQGRMTWKTPDVSGPLPTLRLRASSGRHEAVREVNPWMMVDADPPRAELRGPSVWEGEEAARLETAVFDDLAGVASITLWWRNPGTGAIEAVKTVEPGRDLGFQPQTDGRYALWISAKDALGNSTPEPRGDAAPMLELLVDHAPPETSILAPKGGEVLEGGRPFLVAWAATDANLPERPVALFASRDQGATWELWQDSLPSHGEATCAAPREGGALWLRLVAMDAAGHRGESFLEPPLDVRGGGEAVPVPVPAPVPAPTPVPPEPPVEVSAMDIPLLEGPPSRGGAVAGGKVLELAWSRPAASAGRTVLVEWSSDGGATWNPAGKAQADAGRLSWPVPSLNGAVRLRLGLFEGDRRLGSSLTRPFIVASRAPRLALKPPAASPEP